MLFLWTWRDLKSTTLRSRISNQPSGLLLSATGCGSQRLLHALRGVRILLAAAPTTPPCFCRRQRSSLLQVPPHRNVYRGCCRSCRIPAWRFAFYADLERIQKGLPAAAGSQSPSVVLCQPDDGLGMHCAQPENQPFPAVFALITEVPLCFIFLPG